MEEQRESVYEKDRRRLELINMQLDSEPGNADLWLEKAIYTYDSLTESIQTKTAAQEEIAEIAIRYALKSGQYGKEGLDYIYVRSFLYFVCHDYKKVIALLAPVVCTDQFWLTNRTNNMLSMLVHSYADLGEIKAVDRLLQIMEANGAAFSEEYANVVLRQDLLWIKRLFFKDTLLQYEKLHDFICRWSEESYLDSGYFERIAQICVVMEEMTLFFNQDEIKEKLIFYQQEYGNSFVIKVFGHWIECGYQFMSGDFAGDIMFDDIESAASLLNKTFVYEDLKTLSRPGTYMDILKNVGHQAWFEKRRMLRALYLYLFRHGNIARCFAYPCMGDLYIGITNADLDLYFYQKACRSVLNWDHHKLIAFKVMFFRRYAYVLTNHGRLGQALRCLEFASRYLPEIEDSKLLERFYEIWSWIYERMGLEDKAIEIWSNSKAAEACKESKIKSIIDKPEVFFLASLTDGSIPRRSSALEYGDLNMHFSYSSVHGLYHSLYMRWREIMDTRANFEHREEGAKLWEKVCVLHRALVKAAIQTQCYDFALEHIEEYSCFELQQRILFLKNIYRRGNQAERSNITGFDKAYRQLADVPWGSHLGLFTDAKALSRKVERAGHEIFHEKVEYAESQPDWPEQLKTKHLILEFYYDDENTYCFTLDALSNSILDILIFLSAGEKEIEELSESIYDSDVYNFFRTKPDGSLEIKAARLHAFEEVLRSMDAYYYPLMKEVFSTRYSPEMLVIIPYRALYHLPLHLLGYSAGEAFADRYTISFAPNYLVYRELLGRESPNIQNAVLFADSLGNDERYRLPFAQYETEKIGTILKEKDIAVSSYAQSAASYGQALQVFAGANLMHIGCHTFFDAENPEQSGVMLYDNEEKIGEQEAYKVLTLKKIWDEIDLQNCRLINLSSCYSAASETGGYGANEFWGIPNGCLYAGADCVLANAGKVNDMVAYIFNMRFYTHLCEMGANRALKRSIQELCSLSMRDLYEEIEQLPEGSRRLAKLQLEAIEKHFGVEHPLAHPIFWSGFRMIGEW